LNPVEDVDHLTRALAENLTGGGEPENDYPVPSD